MSGMVMVGCGSVVDSLSATRIALTEFNNGVFPAVYTRRETVWLVSWSVETLNF